MSKQRQLLERAASALSDACHDKYRIEHVSLINEIMDELAKPEQEPLSDDEIK